MYLICVIGMVLDQFAIGGLADWIPTYIHRTQEISLTDAGFMVVKNVFGIGEKHFKMCF